MKSPLHILHLEDNANDAALIEATIKRGGIDCTTQRVEDRAEFVNALEQGGVDLILSDCSLPTFDGLSAVAIAQELWPEVPLILVSGTLGEELAIDAMKNGATDYVLKERLARLAPAVRRAMQEVEDRTERQKLSAQFIEAQKMEVIGHIASGVAHDFNNILAITMFATDLLATELGPDSPLWGYTEEIRLASQRAVGLTRQLLAFSRKQAVEAIVLDLNEVLKDMDQMLRRLIDEHITLTLSPGSEMWSVKADPGYIGQVLMNLVVNARDAMPSGGQITIATSNVSVRVPAEAHPDAVPGDYVLLSVTDTGAGMTDDVKTHLFEAFFTTKPVGKGTGLGLSTCHNIVHQSGGYIDVESELGRGTTFRIYLPRVDQPLSLLSRPSATDSLPRGTETLLIVEDEPSVRHLARRVLQSLGYEALSASNGQDGLHVARQHHGSPIRLVISDIVMPLMGGKVMAEWLRTADPQLKVIFTSGYSDEFIAHDSALEPGMSFMAKPYTPSVLARKVREMLDMP